MSQGPLSQKIRFLSQKVCPAGGPQTQTRKWLLRAPFQGFMIFSFNLSSRIGPISGFQQVQCRYTVDRSRHTLRDIAVIWDIEIEGGNSYKNIFMTKVLVASLGLKSKLTI